MPTAPPRRRWRTALIVVGALAITAVLALLAIVTARPTPPRDTRLARVNGHTVAYRVLGSGRPVIVMLSGLGDGMESFADVAPVLAAHATVILYDRPGYGGSLAAPGARDAAVAADDLDALLRATGIRGPYVIVGHSLGGLYAEYFASRNPAAVAALVLEESRAAGYGDRCRAARVGLCAPPAVLMALSPLGAQSEAAALDVTETQVAAATPLAGGPVLVISRPLPAKPSAIDTLWSATQTDLAARYPGARHVIAPSGGHAVHRDNQDWYARTLLRFAASAGK